MIYTVTWARIAGHCWDTKTFDVLTNFHRQLHCGVAIVPFEFQGCVGRVEKTSPSKRLNKN